MKVDFKPFKTFKGTKVLRQADGLAYAYVTAHTSVDADGAPNAYHPGDVGKNCIEDEHIGLDCPSHAGYPRTSWWPKVLVPDPANPKKPYLQPKGRYAGYFVCMTSLRAKTGDALDTSTYVDSREFPYVVIPTQFTKENGFGFWQEGDVGLATFMTSGKSVPFIVADAGGGPDAKLGEGSIALFAALGGSDPNPRTGAGVLKGDYQYIIFPNSHRSGSKNWPRTKADIRTQVNELIKSTPGIEK